MSSLLRGEALAWAQVMRHKLRNFTFVELGTKLKTIAQPRSQIMPSTDNYLYYTTTTFNTQLDHFGYLVMSFGLTSALAVFQALGNDILRDMLKDFLIVHIDDILIFFLKHWYSMSNTLVLSYNTSWRTNFLSKKRNVSSMLPLSHF